MATQSFKWLFYTVLVGLIPVLSRLLIFAIDQSNGVPVFDATDFIVFGLVLQISNINQIEHFPEDHQPWKTIHNGSSVFFAIMYAVLFCCQIVDQSNPDLFDDVAILRISWIMGGASLLLSGTVSYRRSKLVTPWEP